ncbi:hypothetical protein CKO11_11390 [Rhodobacter sp. TJ_12]|uniref:putative hemolysin n=1 Tax=Rhodobacter sp. TJ_12 TaxID=2029399 RepID=UPI001CBF78B8|nr:DUF333 domain-containing protein [Rhodobacter sp. TJ_12]MBZ4023062.1 hypothetical protein [Rhodobacter sp. TJ_12]
MKRLICLVLPVAALAACTETTSPEDTPVGLANPASAYCVEQGGTVVAGVNPGDDAVCALPDGRKVGEWEYYNEHHRPEALDLGEAAPV